MVTHDDFAKYCSKHKSCADCKLNGYYGSRCEVEFAFNEGVKAGIDKVLETISSEIYPFREISTYYRNRIERIIKGLKK